MLVYSTTNYLDYVRIGDVQTRTSLHDNTQYIHSRQYYSTWTSEATLHPFLSGITVISSRMMVIPSARQEMKK